MQKLTTVEYVQFTGLKELSWKKKVWKVNEKSWCTIFNRVDRDSLPGSVVFE